jgi:thioredoxin-related protein
MKKAIFLFIAGLISFAAYSQPADTTSYLSNKNIPPINIIQADSTWFTNTNIPKNKPVVIIYFSPECGHCQLAAQEIYTNSEKLKEAFFIWVTYYSVPEIKTFQENYKLAQLSNFRLGRDPKYAIPTFYKVRFTPFMAVYDKNGHLVQAFEQGTDPETLAKLIHEKS